MKRLLLLFGILFSLSSVAQQHPKLALINEAELAIVDGQLEKAAGIYEQLFLQKDEIWAQDLYNAAVVEMKLGSFEYAKKYLNELAKRGISLEALESVSVFEEMKSSFQWQSYTTVYNQLQEYSIKTNHYTDFITGMETTFDSLQLLSYEISYIPIRTTTADSTKILFEGKTLYAIPNSELTDGLQDLLLEKIDSVQQLPARLKKLEKYNAGCNEALEKYKSFFAKNDWPYETKFNNVRAHTIANPLNLISRNLLLLPDLGSAAKDLIETKTTNEHFFRGIFKGEDSLAISNIVIKATREGRLKPFTAIQILNYREFLNFQNFKVFELRIDQSEKCQEINGQYFVKYLPLQEELQEKYKSYETTLGIQKQEDFIKKALFMHRSLQPYSFNVRDRIEVNVFSNCETARAFITDAEPFERMK